ncbi:MAG: 1-deoxy-D-xylulose-5-phosphate synthase [Lachnospiraceae bacterium]|nr:1-deoxy-D-xylulose-5-phosphate synthase [Lachnospiraceae bacterium]
MYKILRQIEKPNDIKTIAPEDYRRLASEIRSCLVNSVSRTGGHLASNLGVVELTMALHICLDFPEDKLIWDVGHQSYVHKILTGRWNNMDTIRNYGGLSGFPSIEESETDAFDTGHASTSVSAALGYAHAARLQGKKNKVFAVIGDGSITGGMFYEAINNAASLKSNMVIILNDNNMSISKNVGGMSKYLTKLRTASQYTTLKDNIEYALKKMPYIGENVIEKIRRSKSSLKHLVIPGMFFEDMGLTYIGPVDGHNVNQLVKTFENAVNLDKPVIIHVKTKKGRGYRLAEENPCFFHGVEPFDVRSGELKKKRTEGSLSYTEVFGKKLCEMAAVNDRIVAVCAAMPQGTGLIPFSEKYNKRFFDVGIAEEHAVTFAAGLAADEMIPVVSIYSTFLQRAYDQIIHDVCKTRRHVVFAVDRSGITGNDGETHQGIYDVSFLCGIPGMTILSPKNHIEFEDMLEFAVNQFDGPVAVRYPRGDACMDMTGYRQEIAYGRAEILYGDTEEKRQVLLLAAGSMVATAVQAADRLKADGVQATVVNMRFIKPLDTALLNKLIPSHDIIVTLEENVISGGISEQVASYMQWNGFSGKKCIPVCLPDTYVKHGNPDVLKEKYGLTSEAVAEKILRETV